MERNHYQGLINKYREYLPVTDKTPIITLNEGNTPLIKADNLARKIGLKANVYLKYEGANPTGSFKDRGMTMAVTKAVEDGSKAIICASTGNTSAAAAAYGAKAGVRVFVLIPDGYIALGKLSQAMMYGAEIIAIKGNFDEALEMVMSGWDESDGALYFESEKSADNWHSRHLEYLFTHGGHRFYK